MALNNYANLKQAVERFSHRTDISDVIDDFIDLCEARINARLKLRTNEQRSTATMPTADRFLQLPDNFLEMRRLTLVGANPREIRFKSPESMTVEPNSGVPEYFTVTSQLEFNRVPDSGYTVEMSYYVSLTALSDSNTTNDVLTKYPDLYLYGTLSELYRWARDEEAASYYDGTFEKKLLDAQKQERRGRFGPAPAMYSEGATP